MTIQELVRILWKRSGKTQDDYSQVVLGFSRGHLNAVITGREPGTPLILERAIRYAGLDWDDVLMLPPDPSDYTSDEAAENARALQTAKDAIVRGGQDREHVIEQMGLLDERVRKRREKQKGPRPRRSRKQAQSAA